MGFTGSSSGHRAQLAESGGIFNSKCGLSVKKGVVLNTRGCIHSLEDISTE